MRDRMIIMDPQGNRLCMLQRQIMALRSTFQVYSYQPNQEGQESTETVDNVPVYRFAMIEKQISDFVGQYCYKLYKGNDNEETVVICAAQMAFQLTLKMYRKGDEAKKPLATVGQTEALQFDSANEYALSVAKGMDLLAMLCLAVAVDDIQKDD